VGFSSALIDVVPETKSAQRPKSAASSMRSRTSSPPSRGRSGRGRRRRPPTSVTRKTETMLLPPRPSRWTGPPGQRSPRSSVPTSITSELLRGLGSPLGSRPDLDLDRLERLDVVSPDQGDDGASVEIGRSRPHRHTPPSEHRWRSGTAPTSSPSCVRMRPSERGWSSRTERPKGRRRSGGPG